MSISPSENQVALTVKAADSLTEIFLVDSRFKRIAAGIGSVETSVVPGLYKARFRSGQIQNDHLVEVDGDAAIKIFNGPAVEFATAVPMPQTMAWQQEHGQAAQELSQAVQFEHGSGSQLLLFFRGLTKEASCPWEGVSLHDLDGTLVAEARRQGVRDERNRFFALHLAVAPGTYRLRVQEEPGETYEMFVVTLAGWQTQIFALAEKSWMSGVNACRAALPAASVLMAEIGKGFRPTDPLARQTELLRLGLMNKRSILAEAGLKSLLTASPLNPMTAIFALHLSQRHNNAVLTAELIKHLHDSIITHHPDVQAALLAIAGNTEQMPIFSNPPMLNRSWRRLIEAEAKEKTTIPFGSLNDQIRNSVLKTSLWLMRRLP